MKTPNFISTIALIIFSLNVFSNDAEKSQLSLNVIAVSAPTCSNSANGSITVEAVGGEAPYTFNWNTYPSQSTPTAINLTAGIYFIEVKDANGDVYFESIEVKAPDQMTSTGNETEATSLSPEVNLTFLVGGGNAPYSYELNEEAISDPVDLNLSVGIHKMVITDANNCQMVQYIQVYELEESPQNEGDFGWNKEEDDNIDPFVAHIEISPLVPYTSNNNVLESNQLIVHNEGK